MLPLYAVPDGSPSPHPRNGASNEEDDETELGEEEGGGGGREEEGDMTEEDKAWGRGGGQEQKMPNSAGVCCGIKARTVFWLRVQ